MIGSQRESEITMHTIPASKNPSDIQLTQFWNALKEMIDKKVLQYDYHYKIVNNEQVALNLTEIYPLYESFSFAAEPLLFKTLKMLLETHSEFFFAKNKTVFLPHDPKNNRRKCYIFSIHVSKRMGIE